MIPDKVRFGLSRHCELNIKDEDISCALILPSLQIWSLQFSEGTPFPEFNFWKWSSICPVLLCSVLSCCCQTEPDILILGVYWSWNRWYIFENVTKAGAISCDVGNLGIYTVTNIKNKINIKLKVLLLSTLVNRGECLGAFWPKEGFLSFYNHIACWLHG